MHPLVRDLYRRLMWVGRDYPAGLAHVRERAKREFRQNADLTDERGVLEAVHRGRWWLREMEGVIKLRKYRAMAQRYGHAGSSAADAEARLEAGPPRSEAAEPHAPATVRHE
jgi:hypothetical protein